MVTEGSKMEASILIFWLFVLISKGVEPRAPQAGLAALTGCRDPSSRVGQEGRLHAWPEEQPPLCALEPSSSRARLLIPTRAALSQFYSFLSMHEIPF